MTENKKKENEIILNQFSENMKILEKAYIKGNPIFDIKDAPLWLQERILENSNENTLKKLYNEYKNNGKMISESDRIMIQSIIKTKLITYGGPFYFTFMKSPILHNQILEVPTHKKAIEIAEILSYKRIELCTSFNDREEKNIDYNIYDKKSNKWSGWETKVNDE